MVPNVVLTSLIAGYLYLSFSVCILLVSFSLCHFKKFCPVFLKVAESPPWGRIWWSEGRKIKGGDRGSKKHQGGKNAQPLIDHRINFSILLLWLVSSLPILIYYDKRWRLLLKQFICWIFTLDGQCTRLQLGIFQCCGAVVKMSQLRFRSSWFSCVWPRIRSSLFSWLRLQLRLQFVFTH